MIDPEIIAYTAERLAIEIGVHEKRISNAIAMKITDMSNRGLQRSSMMILEVQAVCVLAAAERAELIWEVLHRAVTTVGIKYDDDVEMQMRTFVEPYFLGLANGLKSRVVEAAQRFGMNDFIARNPIEIEDACRMGLNRLFSEMRLFTMTLKKIPEAGEYSPQFTFHNSTIGAVQSGHQSVANINLQNNAEGRDALIKALDVIAQELAQIDSIPGQNRNEIVELVKEGKGELIKETPNYAKISSYLPVIGGAITVMTKLKPAYEGLKLAAAAVGISLP